MIFLPVSPASPCGPPMMNLPEGLMYMCVKSPKSEIAGFPFFRMMSESVFFTTSSVISRFISSMLGAVASGAGVAGHLIAPGRLQRLCVLGGNDDGVEFL